MTHLADLFFRNGAPVEIERLSLGHEYACNDDLLRKLGREQFYLTPIPLCLRHAVELNVMSAHDAAADLIRGE